MTQENVIDLGKVKLKNVRLSFPQLFEKDSYKGSDPCYSANFILDKGKHKSEIVRIKKGIAAVAKEAYKDKVPKKLKVPLYDGDERDGIDGYGEDVMYISTRSYKEFPIADKAGNVLTENNGKFYAGCHVHAVVRLWAQDNEYGRRINCELKAVMFAKDGEPFGDGKMADVAEEFAEEIEEAEEAGFNALGEDDEEEDDLLG